MFNNFQVHITILYKYKRLSFKVQKDRKLVKLNPWMKYTLAAAESFNLFSLTQLKKNISKWLKVKKSQHFIIYFRKEKHYV